MRALVRESALIGRIVNLRPAFLSAAASNASVLLPEAMLTRHLAAVAGRSAFALTCSGRERSALWSSRRPIRSLWRGSDRRRWAPLVGADIGNGPDGTPRWLYGSAGWERLIWKFVRGDDERTSLTAGRG